MMTFVSFWVKRTPWLWGTFLFLSLLFALDTQIITWIALLPLAGLGLFHFLLHKHLQGHLRTVFLFLTAGISLALMVHLFPGFHNHEIGKGLVLKEGAIPYNFWVNFDKPFIAIFLLAWALPLIENKMQLKKVLAITLPLSALGIALIMAISLYFHIVRFDAKIPLLVFLWPLVNLFFVAIPEEVFFRGFIQEELFQKLKTRTDFAGPLAVLITALVFTLLHVFWVSDFSFLLLVFVAGCIFGAIYQITKAIEASIFCHFMLNLIHFLFFTYPMLQR